MSWIEVTTPAPVLNTPHFSTVFGGSSDGTIPLSPLGHPEYFEFVALKYMQFEVFKQIGSNILQIYWPEYSTIPLYIDRRFCQELRQINPQISIDFSTKALLTHMESRVGTPYVWGGNWAQGIPEMLLYYPPPKKLTKHMLTLWTLQGLDCSGLLFEATQGLTPRNTSHLLRFGRSLLPDEPLEPLDMIIYPGHVLFVRDQTSIIESKSPFGVRICPLIQRIAEISQDRQFVYNWDARVNGSFYFTIRRFS